MAIAGHASCSGHGHGNQDSRDDDDFYKTAEINFLVLIRRQIRCMFLAQRGITPRVYIAELPFLCSAHNLICLKFHENILNGFQLVGWQ